MDALRIYMAQEWQKRKASEQVLNFRVPRNEGKRLACQDARWCVTSDLILLPAHHVSPTRGHITKYEYTINITQLFRQLDIPLIFPRVYLLSQKCWTPLLYLPRPYYEPCPINICVVSTPLPDPWKSERNRFDPSFWDSAQSSDAQTKWRYEAKSFIQMPILDFDTLLQKHILRCCNPQHSVRHKSIPKDNKPGKIAVKCKYFT